MIRADSVRSAKVVRMTEPHDEHPSPPVFADETGERDHDVLDWLGMGDDEGVIRARSDDAPLTDRPDDRFAQRVETIAFEALRQGLHDARVASLLHVLGWSDEFSCFAVAGTPVGAYATTSTGIRLGIHNLGGRLSLIGRHGHRCAVVAVVHGAATPEVTCTALLDLFDAHQPVCLVPAQRDLAGASRVLRAAFSSLAAAPAVQPLPRPMRADDVLPERALLGDADAREELYTTVYASLLREGDDDPTLSTISAFIRTGGSLDLTAHELNVHPNTVRYRLKRAAETTGWDATDPREAFVLQTAIAVGHMRDAAREDS